MRSMVVFSLLIASIAASMGGEPDYSRPKKHLGFATSEGLVVFWSELKPAPLSDGTLLPVRLRFSTESPAGQPLFGQYWWCPLLESCIIPRNERTFALTTLGGHTVYLVADKTGKFSSGDGRYTASKTSDSTILVEADGWKYRFVNGALKNATRDDGTELEWVSSASGRTSSLVEKGKGAILSVGYAPGSGIPAAVTIGNHQYQLEFQQVPIVSFVSGQALVAGYAPSLAAIEGGGVGEKFPITLGTNGDFTLKYSSSNWPARDYVWSGQNGRLKSDGTWKYEVVETAGMPAVVKRTNDKGQTESYFYDPKTGTSEHKRPDGTVVTRLYFLAKGPTQYSIRKLTTLKDGKLVDQMQWSYDELGRLIRRESQNSEETWSYHENGQVASWSESLGGQILQEENFDSEGRKTQLSRKGRIYKYTYEAGRTIVQKVENGKVVATKVSDPRNLNEVFLAGSSPDELKAMALPGQVEKISPEEIGAATALAVKVLENTKR